MRRAATAGRVGTVLGAVLVECAKEVGADLVKVTRKQRARLFERARASDTEPDDGCRGTFRALAVEIGIGEQVLLDLVAGTRKPQRRTLANVARYLDIPQADVKAMAGEALET